MPSEKVARLGIRREAGHMYFLRGNEVWKAPMVAPGSQEPRRPAERIAVGDFECEENYLYFFDSVGDISRAERKTASRPAASHPDRDRASALKHAAELIRERAAEQPWCDEALKQLQPSLRLRLMPKLQTDVVGASRFGGVPDLPAGTEWPTRDEATPLSFIAQINLADLPTDDLVPLPRRGVLSFFYDVAHQPSGSDPSDRGSSRILYFEEPGQLAPARKPAALPELYSYPARTVSATWDGTLPETVPSLLPAGDPSALAYRALVDELIGPGSQHRMLGHAQPVQSDSMQLECELATNGIDCDNAAAYEDPRVRALRAGAADWMLLLQLDSANVIGWSWGDAGRLYFWIRKPDLAARRFDRVWTILQCH